MGERGGRKDRRKYLEGRKEENIWMGKSQGNEKRRPKGGEK